MSISEFFIGRPVFATILNALFVVVGLLALSKLSVAEYPEVSIPVISVFAEYPNASAELVESEVTLNIEDGVSGLPGLETIRSWSRYGNSEIQLMFKPGTSMQRAVTDVRDRLSRTRSLLPKDMKEPQVEPRVNGANALMYLTAENPNLSDAELFHFVALNTANSLKSIDGVGSARPGGRMFTMNLALDRRKLVAHKLDAADVIEALERHQTLLPAGRLFKEIPISIDATLKTEEDFKNVVIKNQGQSVTRLSDVADVSLSNDNSAIIRVNGQPGLIIPVTKTGDGNPLSIHAAVTEMLPALEKELPEGSKLRIIYSEANFIKASLNNLKKAIIEACVLVIFIIFLFLRNLPSTFIPLIAIPLSLVATFGCIWMAGFTLNTITLFALVLAVGLVVDDAIVVVENIHRHIEKGLTPFEAAKKGSREIAFAIVAMTLTLASVYAPIAFIGGVVGKLFIEFAVSLAGAVIVSGVVAITLSPMLCARMLKPHSHAFLPKLDEWFTRIENGYGKLLNRLLMQRKLAFIAFAALIVANAALFVSLPKSLAPKEDRGFLGVNIPPLPGKAKETLLPYVQRIQELLLSLPETQSTLASLEENMTFNMAVLKPWGERKRSQNEIVEEIKTKVAASFGIDAYPWGWDMNLPGSDTGGPMEPFAVVITGLGSYKELFEQVKRLKDVLEKDGVVRGLHMDLKLDDPGLDVHIDETKAEILGLVPARLAKDIAVATGQLKPMRFLKDARRYEVTLSMGEPLQNLNEVFVTAKSGAVLSLGAVATLEPTTVASSLPHENQLRSTILAGDLAPGKNLADAMASFEQRAKDILPTDTFYEFTGLAKEQAKNAETMALLFVMALVFIYCILAIQFESFLDPFVILLTVPLASVGALGLLLVARQDINIFTQIGLVTLVGLVAKHGILLVDFANQLKQEGRSLIDAAREAATLRLRPILMTTAAMVFGALPLIVSSGAGAEARQAIGYVLVGGLVVGTLFTLFLLPTFWVILKSLKDRT